MVWKAPSTDFVICLEILAVGYIKYADGSYSGGFTTQEEAQKEIMRAKHTGKISVREALRLLREAHKLPEADDESEVGEVDDLDDVGGVAETNHFSNDITTQDVIDSEEDPAIREIIRNVRDANLRDLVIEGLRLTS
jgi:predicted transcriptional regulator